MVGYLQECYNHGTRQFKEQYATNCQNVDNFYKNRNLGLLFEVKAGDGKLLVCSSDLAKNLNTRPVARQLLYSLLKYMESDKFNPQEEVAFKQIKQVLHNVNRTKEVKKSIYE